MASKRKPRRSPSLVLTAEIARQWCERQPDGSLGHFDPLDAYTNIEYAAAKILGQCDGRRELNLDGLTELTPAVARALAKYEGSLCLNGIRELDPETAQILAGRRHKITLLEGLETLEHRGLAKTLAATGEENGDLYFQRLRKLSPQAAKVLVRADCRLSFGGRARFSPKVIAILNQADTSIRFFGRKHLRLQDVFGLGANGRRHDGELVFVDVKRLDADAAAELARYPGAAIRFLALQEISSEAATALAAFPGTLDLRDLNSCPAEAALALAHGAASTRLQSYGNEAHDGCLIVRLSDEGVFNLGEIQRLTPALAATLSAAPILDFRNLKKLTPEAARVLAEKHRGSLLLNGLESLSDNLAAALAGHHGGLSLRGLSRISLSSAKSLTSTGGFLSLGGLQKLGPRLAAVLSEFPGSLMLDGVKELTPGVARKLQKHTGLLSMNGLTEISLETAEILASKPNQKRMVHCGGSVAALQYLLKNDPERVTLMFRLNAHGDFQ